MSTQTIDWGDATFENVGPFEGWLGPGGAGAFAVMCKSKTGDFRVVYFGEHEDIATSDFFRNHAKFRCCVSEGGCAADLYFGFLPLPLANAEQRKHIVKLLAEQFRPICNW